MNRTFKRLACTLPLLGLALGLASCGWIRTDPPAPINPMPQQWQSTGETGGANARDLAWEDYFTDPRLRALIQTALQNNLDLRATLARLEQARAAYGVSRSDALPRVDATASYNSSRTAEDVGQPGMPLILRSYAAALQMLSYEIDIWGRAKASREASYDRYLASEQAARAFRISLIAEVAQAYLKTEELGLRLRLARSTLTSREESQKLMQMRLDAGLSSNFEVLQSEGLLESARASVADLQNQQVAAANALQLLVVHMPESLPEGIPLNEQSFTPLGPGLPSQVLLARPDVQEAEKQLLADHVNIAAVRAAFLPRISLTASLGRSSKDLDQLFQGRNRTWNFVPSADYPLFSGGRMTSSLDLANAQRSESLANYEKAIQQAFWEVNTLMASKDSLRDLVDAQEKYQRSQTERLSLAQQRYTAGVSSYIDVLDAQREAFGAQQAYVQSRSAYLTNSILIYKALGGGDLKANEKLSQTPTPQSPPAKPATSAAKPATSVVDTAAPAEDQATSIAK